MADRDEVKALLARAGVEINNALRRADGMSDQELTDVQNMSASLRAFFDKNGTCGAPTARDLRAFFDKNGTCAQPVADVGDAVLNRVLRRGP